MEWISETTMSKARSLGFPLESVSWTQSGTEEKPAFELWLHWTGKRTKAVVSHNVIEGFRANRGKQRRETENWISQVLRSLMRYSKGIKPPYSSRPAA
jgi:hypothetical protein